APSDTSARSAPTFHRPRRAARSCHPGCRCRTASRPAPSRRSTSRRWRPSSTRSFSPDALGQLVEPDDDAEQQSTEQEPRGRPLPAVDRVANAAEHDDRSDERVAGAGRGSCAFGVLLELPGGIREELAGRVTPLIVTGSIVVRRRRHENGPFYMAAGVYRTL